jgi:hypothetical protein
MNRARLFVVEAYPYLTMLGTGVYLIPVLYLTTENTTNVVDSDA